MVISCWVEWTVSLGLTAWCGYEPYGSIFFLMLSLGSWISCLFAMVDDLTRWSRVFGRIVVVDVATQEGCLGSFVMLIRAYDWRPHGLSSSLGDSCVMPRPKWVIRLGFGLVNQPGTSPFWYFYFLVLVHVGFVLLWHFWIWPNALVGSRPFVVSTMGI